MNVAIVGVTGYVGIVLYNLLKNHPKIDEINLYKRDLKNSVELKTISSYYPQSNKLVEPYDSKEIMDKNDVVFFATPAGVTSKLAKPFLDNNFPVIDLSGDFRLNNAEQYQKWYQKEAADPYDLNKSYYGLADLNSNPGKNYIANPGCYATSVLLGLAPLVKNNLIDPDIVIDAKSGLSGAGKGLSKASHFIEVDENLQIYKPNQHKHIPEIMAQLKQWNSNINHIQFMTTLIPINRGIMSSIYVKLKNNIDFKNVKEKFEELYSDSIFVKIFVNELPTIKNVVGTNECHIGLSYNPITNYLLVDSVIDNMIKGAAGQAIQNFNQLFHFGEYYGLELSPFLP